MYTELNKTIKERSQRSRKKPTDSVETILQVVEDQNRHRKKD